MKLTTLEDFREALECDNLTSDEVDNQIIPLWHMYNMSDEFIEVLKNFIKQSTKHTLDNIDCYKLSLLGLLATDNLDDIQMSILKYKVRQSVYMFIKSCISRGISSTDLLNLYLFGGESHEEA